MVPRRSPRFLDIEQTKTLACQLYEQQAENEEIKSDNRVLKRHIRNLKNLLRDARNRLAAFGVVRKLPEYKTETTKICAGTEDKIQNVKNEISELEDTVSK